MHRLSFACGVVACAIVSVSLPAQTFRGLVVDDSTRRPLGAATMVLLDASGRELSQRTRSDSAGRYTLHVGVTGTYQLRALHVGHQPLTSERITFFGGEVATVNFSLSAVAIRLGSVVVTARERLGRDELMSITGFELRRSRGIGVFLDTTELGPHKRAPLANAMTEIATAPRVMLNEWALRGPQIFMMRSIADTCWPQIFVDGFDARTSPSPRDNGSWRLTNLSADLVYGIEVYSRALIPPPSIGGEIGDYFEDKPRAWQCGVILVWTKVYHAEWLRRNKEELPFSAPLLPTESAAVTSPLQDPMRLYWGLYDLKRGDTMTFTVTGAETRRSAATNIGRFPGLVAAQTNASVRSTEQVQADEVLAQSSIGLNIANLNRGTHTLRLEAHVTGQELVSVSRTIEIVR